ncbi:MAG TPA: triose-phosphate isomerase [Tepidisphaeraceae bacterium]|jgi:triosephosphate isomerase
MPRTKFVVGNWKMNTNKASATELARAVAKGAPEGGVELGVAPPLVYLDVVGQVLKGSRVMLGAQDVCAEKNGAFTGACSTDMLLDLGAKFCLTGHSERRHFFMESPELVSKKAAVVYGAGMILIHCVGEKIEQRDAGKTFAVVEAQLKELDPGSIKDPKRLVIAYEPVWAIGTGRNATDAQAQEVHAFIRNQMGKMWNKDFADTVRIQYGGSMKPENAKGLLSQADVDGGLIGGASLKPDSFLAIVNAAK